MNPIFQFHLVRLKDTCRLLEYLGYGFQFHLVRLKGGSASG